VRRLVSRLAMGTVLAVAVVFGVPIAGQAASGPVMVDVPAHIETHTLPAHACTADASGQCYDVWTLHVPAHREFRDPSRLVVTSAHACDARSYLLPWEAWDEYGLFGVHAYHAEEDAEVWYDGCSAGTVWNTPNCSGWGGWYCAGSKSGSFWDGGQGANTSWLNEHIGYSPPPGDNNCVYLRIWNSPGGSQWGSASRNQGDACP
jgi:hypothetical protein